MDVAYKNWQRKMTFDSSRPESSVLGKQGIQVVKYRNEYTYNEYRIILLFYKLT